MRYLQTSLLFLCLISPAWAARNIILILADDMSPHLSALGTKGIQTPNIDALAENGLLFTQAYAPAASCSPCRSSIMTGMYPHSHGGWRNMNPTPLSAPDSEFTHAATIYDKRTGVHEDIPTMAEILRDANYFTGITFKSHMSPPWKFPFEGRNNIGNHPRQFKKVIKGFIEQAGRRPFFIQANISAPHRPFHTHLKWNPEQQIPDELAIEVPGYLADIPEVRQELREYLACVEITDACAGAIIEALEESGVRDDTLIVFSADQGFPFIRAKASAYYAGLKIPMIFSGPGVVKGQRNDELVSLIDLMPTFLQTLRIGIPDTVQGKSLVNILNGSEDNLPGRDVIFGEHNSHGPIEREHYPSRVVTNGRWYYIKNLMPEKQYELPGDLRVEQGWGTRSYEATIAAKDSHPEAFAILRQLEQGRPPEELYDLSRDPYQLNNLADNPEYSEHLKNARKMVENWRSETGDFQRSPNEVIWRRPRGK